MFPFIANVDGKLSDLTYRQSKLFDFIFKFVNFSLLLAHNDLELLDKVGVDLDNKHKLE